MKRITLYSKSSRSHTADGRDDRPVPGPVAKPDGGGGQLAARPAPAARARAFMARHERIVLVVFTALLSSLVVIGYTATKHAITGLTKSTSLDGRKYNIACGQIDIGNAATEMAKRLGEGAVQADGSVRPEPLMDVSVVADAVLYMANLPLDANVQFMTVMATKMPFIGRG